MLGSIFGSGINAAANLKAQDSANKTNIQIARETNQANRELAEYSYQQNLAQWNRENEYNSPTAQMARLQEAGLNPNLVYGSGSAVQSSASSPQYDAPTMQAAKVGAYTGINFGIGEGIAAMYQNQQIKSLMSKQDAERTLIHSQADEAKARVLEALSRIRNTNLDSEARQMKNDVYKSTMDELKQSPKLENDYKRVSTRLGESNIIMNNAATQRILAESQSIMSKLPLELDKLGAEIDLTETQRSNLIENINYTVERELTERARRALFGSQSSLNNANTAFRKLENMFSRATFSKRVNKFGVEIAELQSRVNRNEMSAREAEKQADVLARKYHMMKDENTRAWISTFLSPAVDIGKAFIP